jgi:ankyrin repeat protein
MHVACTAGNLYVVDRVLDFLESSDFLHRAYGEIPDFESLVDHLLDSFLNTPDKNANNTPLHFACRGGYLEVVKRMVVHPICRRDPLNRWVS